MLEFDSDLNLTKMEEEKSRHPKLLTKTSHHDVILSDKDGILYKSKRQSSLNTFMELHQSLIKVKSSSQKHFPHLVNFTQTETTMNEDNDNDDYVRSYLEHLELNNIFPLKSNLENQAIFIPESCHVCKKCKKSFKRAGGLKCHMIIHNKEEEINDIITSTTIQNITTRKGNPKIKKISRQKQSTSTQANTNNMDDSHLCTVCGKSFSTAWYVKTHMLSHTGENPFMCTQCAYSCYNISVLKIHERTHNGVKLYNCAICGSAFHQSAHLKTHAKTHTGEKPFKCGQCDFSSITSSHLKWHIRKHTGEKPFSCEQCTESFTQSSVLKRHIRIHSS